MDLKYIVADRSSKPRYKSLLSDPKDTNVIKCPPRHLHHSTVGKKRLVTLSTIHNRPSRQFLLTSQIVKQLLKN
jgi:hypothetical protein